MDVVGRNDDNFSNYLVIGGIQLVTQATACALEVDRNIQHFVGGLEESGNDRHSGQLPGQK